MNSLINFGIQYGPYIAVGFMAFAGIVILHLNKRPADRSDKRAAIRAKKAGLGVNTTRLNMLPLGMTPAELAKVNRLHRQMVTGKPGKSFLAQFNTRHS
jgi:hypothetical protein